MPFLLGGVWKGEMAAYMRIIGSYAACDNLSQPPKDAAKEAWSLLFSNMKNNSKKNVVCGNLEREANSIMTMMESCLRLKEYGLGSMMCAYIRLAFIFNIPQAQEVWSRMRMR